tara:strand:+ start:365 stop:469 length:105 start_codon:yes stop_codon:yes gene_type:complete
MVMVDDCMFQKEGDSGTGMEEHSKEFVNDFNVVK